MLTASKEEMPRRQTKEWWHEGKTHRQGKNIIREVAKKRGCAVVEEEPFPVDLGKVFPELWPRKSYRQYQADLLVTKQRGHEIYKVIAEVDGGYHADISQIQDDARRDLAISFEYGIKVVRFDKKALLAGVYTDDDIAVMLGI